MKRTDPKSVGEIISDMIAATGQQDNFDRQRICFLWSEVVGAAINRYTTRRYVEGSVLHVYISSASLKNELSFARQNLVKRLNEVAGAEIITSIIIH